MLTSIAYPNMFSNSKTNLVYNWEATAQNLKSTLLSDKSSMFGDPYFGTNLKKLIYEQNTVVLRDIFIDDIYNAISLFMPQVRVERKDITITSDRATLYVSIKAKNLIDFTIEEVNIALFNLEELE